MEKVQLQTMVEVLYAAHLSSRVETPVEDRCGILLVGPPGSLKTALLTTVDRRYPDVITLSDLNVQMWTKHLREQFSSEQYHTLVLTELAKIYERNAMVASNIEGVLRAFVAEGFRHATFENPNVQRMAARGVVLAGLTPKLHAERLAHWYETGFARRFLIAVYRLANAQKLEDAVSNGGRVEFPEGFYPPIPAGRIPNRTTTEERQALALFLKHQPPPHISQRVFLIRLLAVLQWWYPMLKRTRADAWDTLEEFCALLGKDGAELVLPDNLIQPVKATR